MQSYLPSGTFTLTFQGTEHGVSKGWTGTQDKLSALEEEIVATGLLLLEAQPKRREERLTEERRRRIVAEKVERRRRIAQGRREQLERALKAAEAYEKVERLQRFSWPWSSLRWTAISHGTTSEPVFGFRSCEKNWDVPIRT